MNTPSNNKYIYIKLCEEKDNIPLFMQAWWMDAVCINKTWDVFIYKKNEKIIATWVFHYIKKFGFKIILQPQLTQYNGIWINYPEDISISDKLSLEKEAMNNLLEQMSHFRFSFINQNFHYSFTNWLPFYWKGYEQTTRYTYQIQDISTPEKYFNEFRTSKKSHIKKATKSITINNDLSGIEFYNYLETNLKSLNQNVTYTKELFLSLYKASITRNQGCIFSAKDEKNNFHAALFIVWDKTSAYNLISTITPQFRSSGATSLLFYEAIKSMSSKTKIFDFEGSMNEKIEKSFREFGAIQVPYFNIQYINSLIINILCYLKKY